MPRTSGQRWSFPHICHAFASKRIPVKDFAVCFIFYFLLGFVGCSDFKPSTPGLVSHCSYHDIHVVNVSLKKVQRMIYIDRSRSQPWKSSSRSRRTLESPPLKPSLLPPRQDRTSLYSGNDSYDQLVYHQ